MPNIKLQSSDGRIFDVDIEITKASTTIRTMLEDLGADVDDKEVVPLKKVRSDILEKVIEWATYHQNEPLPVEEEEDETELKRTDDISEWDQNFLRQVDLTTLFELTEAADYLNMKGFMDLACKTIANLIKNKTPGEIRVNFELDKDAGKSSKGIDITQKAPSPQLEAPSPST